uniref:Uncharacterized protein n=1 Tax=Tetranychus urticae TaxID=32264 RepID=T1L1F6_TETUR
MAHYLVKLCPGLFESQMKVSSFEEISSASNSLEISIYFVKDASNAYAFLTVKEPKTTVAVKSEDLENFIDAICLWIIDADNPTNCLNIHFDSQESINIKAGNQEENIRNIDLMDFYHTKLIDLNREETDVLKTRLKFSSIFARFVPDCEKAIQLRVKNSFC